MRRCMGLGIAPTFTGTALHVHRPSLKSLESKKMREVAR